MTGIACIAAAQRRLASRFRNQKKRKINKKQTSILVQTLQGQLPVCFLSLLLLWFVNRDASSAPLLSPHQTQIQIAEGWRACPVTPLP